MVLSLLETFKDDFTQTDLTVNYYPPATSPQYCSVQNGVCVLPTAQTFWKGLETKTHFNAVGSRITWKMTPPSDGNCALSLTHEFLQTDGTKLEGRDLRWTIDASGSKINAVIMGSGTLAPYTPDAGTVSLPYNTAQAWFRIDLSDNINVVWSVSPDGRVFTVVRTSPIPAELLSTDVKVVFGAYGSAAASSMLVDNINVTPASSTDYARFDNAGNAPQTQPSQPPAVTGDQARFDNVGTSVQRLPSAPTGLLAVARNASAELSWSPPANPGSSPVIGYQVTASDGVYGRSYPVTTATQAGLRQLPNARAWTLSVAAVTAIGVGPTAFVTVLPTAGSGAISILPILTAVAAPPAPPTLVSASNDNASSLVIWTAPADDGGSAITGYLVSGRTSAGVVLTATAGPAVTSAALGPLVNGTSYVVTVTATNAAGTSASSAALTAVPAAGGVQQLPSPVTALTATALASGAALAWTVPASLGTGTFVSYDFTAISASGTSSYSLPGQLAAVQLSGLLNSVVYTISVVVRTTLGVSPASTVSVTPLASAPAPNATALQPVSGDVVTPPPPSPSPPLASVLLTLAAFPSGKMFAPRNFGNFDSGAV